MGLPLRSFAVHALLLGLSLGSPTVSWADESILPSPQTSPTVVVPDSTAARYSSSRDRPLPMDSLEVRARRVTRQRGADRIRLSSGVLARRDAGSVADLEALLPSTQLNVNSRGEALFLVRGSSERHLAVELEGIPLTIPWDERSDLSLLPLVGVGEVEAQRGVGSVLDPPNALAGVVRMKVRHQATPGSHTRIGTNLGEVDSWGAQLLHERRDGSLQTTLALEARDRAGFLLPDDYRGGLHQSARRTRLNSDLRQNSMLLDLRHRGTGRLTWGGLIQASEGEKGVPPEEHLDAARYWRYPRRDRVLGALSARVDSSASSRWSLDASASFDWFEQEIRPFDDASYGSPSLTAGVDFEADHDRTGLARLGAQWYRRRWTWRARTQLRHARHRESLVADGPELEYRQNLGALGLEAEWQARPRWTLRGGLGYETATSPRTGDKPPRDADRELSAQLGVEHQIDDRYGWHANLAHRPRFASLREMFSGALGRFEPNPGLRPERQNSFELGGRLGGDQLDVMANLFVQQLDGAIERVGVPGTSLRQRVNLDSILNAGVELGLLWRPRRGLTFDWQHTFLLSRREKEGSYDGRVEDRPDWLSTLALDYLHASGFQGRIEAVGVGPRYSFDDRITTGEERLTRLDADLRTNLRFSWRTFGRSVWFEGAELFVRIENLFDTTTYSQLGLPEAGRSARIGLRFDLRS